ncbi:DUF927 domain-containing protein [Guyparkeria halopsychrophila]|uniref:DUF927 domain-containing protein n=1 Tax=Guyparkeria halopsychrophila TaxID=3139421 RepID=UPI0037CA96BE
MRPEPVPPAISEGGAGGTDETAPELPEPVAPTEAPPPETPELPEPKRPSFAVYNDWTELGRPGLYYHGMRGGKGDKPPEPFDLWVCSPIHVEAITASPQGDSFGRLLRFVNPDGQWREWAMPMRLLNAGGDEMRAELLDLGVRINPEARARLNAWLMQSSPRRRVTAATRTGWHGDELFILPRKTIGEGDVSYQSEHPAADQFTAGGTLSGWRDELASLMAGNPVLVFAVSVGFAGPLFERVASHTGHGFHFVGDSSSGKTTGLHAAASVWGGPDFVRTWRATGNGLEGIAAALNDTLLCLDEISEADSREIGSTVYALGNGVGKTRAARTGAARHAYRWRVAMLSTGERTLAAHMAEGGHRQKAGQSVRLLDIPANRAQGVFDDLHKHEGGRSLADAIKRAAGRHYGHAGPEFVCRLIDDTRDMGGELERALALPAFAGRDGLEGRAAKAFAVAGIAGELATEYGITGWPEGEAMQAAADLFAVWANAKGSGVTEDRQVCDAVAAFIDAHADTRFTNLEGPDKVTTHAGRAGWWRERHGVRDYLFTPTGLRAASPGFDTARIAQALDVAGWLADKEAGYGKRSKQVRTPEGKKRLYVVRLPDEGGDHGAG